MNININMMKDELLLVLTEDAKGYTFNISSFIKNNYTTYNVAINTWLRIVEEGCGLKAARILKAAIMCQGLRPVIAGCCDTANSLISGEGALADFARPLITEDERESLQRLRYLKRFTPIGCEKLDTDSIEKFLALNNSRKGVPSVIGLFGGVLHRSWDAPYWLVKDVREYCHDILKSYKTSSYREGFTNGSVAEGSRILLDKLLALSKNEPNLFESPLYPIGTINDPKVRPVKLVCVPKNYKAKRIIAETGAYANWYLNRIRKDIEETFSHTPLGSRITLQDQGVNQEAARIGSVTGEYATIDLSGASDSIPDALARVLLPSDVYADVTRYNATAMRYGGRVIKRWIFQTSGNPTTFCLETVIFLSICQVATDYVEALTGEEMLDCFTYGDDMIVDARVFQTAMDFLGLLGFTVNDDKSYGTESDFRESCGVEYRKGIDVHTAYYPRKPITDDATSLGALVSLQHRIFHYEAAEAWLHDFLVMKFRQLKLYPSSSPIGEECDDCWDYSPVYKQMNAPFDHTRMEECSVKREIHLSLKAEYQCKEYADADLNVLEMYYYATFLRDGAPLIDTDGLPGLIARSAHLTKSVKDVPRDTGIPVMTWKSTKR